MPGKHHGKAKKCKAAGNKVVYLFNNNTYSNRSLPCKKVCCLKPRPKRQQRPPQQQQGTPPQLQGPAPQGPPQPQGPAPQGP